MSNRGPEWDEALAAAAPKRKGPIERVVVKRDRAGDFYWIWIAANNEPLGNSEGHKNLKDCVDVAERLAMALRIPLVVDENVDTVPDKPADTAPADFLDGEVPEIPGVSGNQLVIEGPTSAVVVHGNQVLLTPAAAELPGPWTKLPEGMEYAVVDPGDLGGIPIPVTWKTEVPTLELVPEAEETGLISGGDFALGPAERTDGPEAGEQT